MNETPTDTVTLDDRGATDGSSGSIEEVVSSLEKRTAGLKGDINRASRVADQMSAVRDACLRLKKQAETLRPATLSQRLARLKAEADGLLRSTREADVTAAPEPEHSYEPSAQADGAPLVETVEGTIPEQLAAPPSWSVDQEPPWEETGVLLADGGERAAAAVERPKMTDVVKTLPRHPNLPPYPRRASSPTMIVIHHTDTPVNFTVQQIASYHVYGERRDSDGSLIKGPWPGIGYHFVIAADGTIFRCQDEMTRSYHVGGAANDTAIGVALIGRFMARGYDGKVQKAALQTPTAKQLASAGCLAAWLMQQYKISQERVVGHKEVWPRSTACPGESWNTGSAWKNRLIQEIKTAQDPHITRQIEHYLLFWDRGAQWAQADWRNAQPYIARFRPTCGFSADDAMLARRVTIVGGPAGVSGGTEQQFRAAGIIVHRLAGRTEAETKAMLDALVAKNTPWPGAPQRDLDQWSADPEEAAAVMLDMTQAMEAGSYRGDEWTVPDDWEAA